MQCSDRNPDSGSKPDYASDSDQGQAASGKPQL
jgi:hypothetical protein